MCLIANLKLQGSLHSWLLLFLLDSTLCNIDQCFSTLFILRTHKLMTKILLHTKKYVFCQFGKKKIVYNFDSIVLAVFILYLAS